LAEIGGKRDEGRGKSPVDTVPRDPVLITSFLAGDPASLLTRLKASNKDIERGRVIGQWRDKYPDPKHLPAVRRWLSELGEYADDLLALPSSPVPLPRVVSSIRAAKDPLTLKDLAVTGDDLIAAGVRGRIYAGSRSGGAAPRSVRPLGEGGPGAGARGVSRGAPHAAYAHAPLPLRRGDPRRQPCGRHVGAGWSVAAHLFRRRRHRQRLSGPAGARGDGVHRHLPA